MTNDQRWKQARPTRHAGVMMRSRTESGFAIWCDKWRLPWEYEPFALSAPGFGQWLPDFRLPKAWTMWGGMSLEKRPAEILVEVKPRGWQDLQEIRRIVSIFEENRRSMEGEGRPIKLIFAQPGRLFEYAPLFEGDESEIIEVTALADINGLESYGVVLAHKWIAVEGPWHGEWWRQ